MPCWIEPIWTTKTCQSHAQNKCIISQSQACVLAAVYILFVSKSKHVASGVHHIKLPNSTNLIVHQMQTDKNTVSQKRTPLLFIIFTTTWAIWTNLIKFFHCWIPKETAEEGPPPPLKSVATQYDYCTLQWSSTIHTMRLLYPAVVEYNSYTTTTTITATSYCLPGLHFHRSRLGQFPKALSGDWWCEIFTGLLVTHPTVPKHRRDKLISYSEWNYKRRGWKQFIQYSANMTTNTRHWQIHTRDSYWLVSHHLPVTSCTERHLLHPPQTHHTSTQQLQPDEHSLEHISLTNTKQSQHGDSEHVAHVIKHSHFCNGAACHIW